MPMRDVAERFWEKVHMTETCWWWTAAKNNRGYGMFGVNTTTLVLAHRWAYEAVRGPIPEGLELDHLCRVPLCVNPAHLEAVTHIENVRRGNAVNRSMCRNGRHAMTPTNRISNPSKQKYQHCGECNKERMVARRPVFNQRQNLKRRRATAEARLIRAALEPIVWTT